MAPHPFATEFIRHRSTEELLREAATARIAFEASLATHRVSRFLHVGRAARHMFNLFASRKAIARQAAQP